MLKKGILFFLMLGCGSLLFAQYTSVIPQAFVPGQASVAYADYWSAFQNPAALTSEKHFTIGLLYENRYITSQLSNAALFLVYPNRFVHVALSYSFFGYSVYNEMMAAATLAHRFGRFSLGVEFDYYTVYASQEQGYKGTITAQVGTQVEVTPHFVIGFNWFNPLFSHLHTFPETKLPVNVALGTSYQFYKSLTWLTQAELQSYTPFCFSTGIIYQIVPSLSVGVGVRISPQVVPNLVVRLQQAGFDFSLQSSYCYPLGFVLSGLFSYHFL